MAGKRGRQSIGGNAGKHKRSKLTEKSQLVDVW